MTDPRTLVRDLEKNPSLPEAAGRERARGYAVAGLPFRSGHALAMRRFPATSVGPGYTSLWHRDPTGRWVIYQDQEPQVSCPRAFGPGIDEAVVVPISIEWTAPDRFSMDIHDGPRVHWHMRLTATPVTRMLNAMGSLLPQAVRRNRGFLAVMSRLAGPMLRVGRVRLAGRVPSRQDFVADLRRIWLIEESTAMIDGHDLGELGPLAQQQALGDFWLPQRGLFAIADGLFEPHDPLRHHLVASRSELTTPAERVVDVE